MFYLTLVTPKKHPSAPVVIHCRPRILFLTSVFFLLLISILTIRPLDAAVKVIDGDSLFIHGIEVRLFGIDAPEFSQTCLDEATIRYPCGKIAKRVLQRFISRGRLQCQRVSIDRYKRVLATCYVDRENINALLVKSGWALAYIRYSKRYIDEQKSARKKRVGMWQGKFISPWDYRHKGPQKAEIPTWKPRHVKYK